MSNLSSLRVIDAHTHVFPPAWIADRSGHVARDRWFGELYEAPTARMVDARELLATMDEAGVLQAVMCGWPWRDPVHCREHNDYLAEASRESGGRLAWLGIANPAGQGAAAEVERCLALGASGIGELNADAQGFSLEDSSSFSDVATVLQQADRPVMVHASEPLGHRYPGKGLATPERLLAFVAAQPGLPIVFAHWGGGLPFYELMPEVAAMTANVWYDTAASTYLYRPAVFRAVLDVVGATRVLWGSDHPVLGMGRFLRRTLRDANLTELEIQRVLAENAAHVYHLPAIA
ncbi:MAG: amidohydrolase family protein [Thermomicrobiales bacterium]